MIYKLLVSLTLTLMILFIRVWHFRPAVQHSLLIRFLNAASRFLSQINIYSTVVNVITCRLNPNKLFNFILKVDGSDNNQIECRRPNAAMASFILLDQSLLVMKVLLVVGKTRHR